MDYPTPSLAYEAPQVPRIGSLDEHFRGRECFTFDPAHAPHSPRQNKLLAAMGDQDYARLLPHLELIPLPFGSTLHEAGGIHSFAYFPISGIVSPLCVMENGAAAAVAMTGNEGMVGTSLFMGGGTTLNRAVVQCAGQAYRLGANRLKHEFERGGHFCQLLLCYTQSLITQMAQTAVCNRYHSIEQQVCRWLLQSLDRMPTNELNLTHELLANMLGVRREGVTDVAGKLQKAGLIRYWRGKITVLDHVKLEARVCECYGAVKGDYDRPARRRRAGVRA